MHADRLLYSICVPSLVLIAQAVFLLERGQTDATERPTHSGGYTDYVTKGRFPLICGVLQYVG